MRKLVSWSTLIILLGCGDTISKTDLAHLNGYWEIEKVTLADGKTKEYTVNTTVDLIKLEGTKGFRKKVNPKLDGTFETSNDAEFFEISPEDGRFILSYKNELSAWKETLLGISEGYFEVSNEAGIRYMYTRFIPINANK
ncbi:MAG: hypothetical protein AAFX53_14595 [Bacteroidota bacterium]